ncbi:MAG: MBL fold metallo-hydrolase [Bacteroidia bacterium]|nr:MBL fold metallo-hydrolase [Bacteroidia bacterium]MDW8159357.1 MBL fold metallo-hydrolase [Bacteroidia bacterium]
MRLFSIETGYFRLDGGAMFGIIPKPLWAKLIPPDSENRILMAMRSLLIEDGNRLFLIDNGLGHKYDSKFAEIYQIDHTQNLDKSLAQHGFSKKDITDLIITHLHFDHAGGTTEIDTTTGNYKIAFPNARIWLQRSNLELAQNPNPREKGSFFDDFLIPITQWENLQLLENETTLTPHIHIKVCNGHTSGMQLPIIQYKNYQILFATDLIPTYAHVPLPYIMAYDTQPLVTIAEKQAILLWVVKEKVILFYQHDPTNECGTVVQDDKGRFISEKTFPLTEITGNNS